MKAKTNINMNTITLHFERDREINTSDNYFLVNIIIDGNKAEAGWIDKTFNSSKFLSDFKSKTNFKSIIIKSVKKFKDKEAYFHYKYDD